jgi:c-di-GMP-binding flagellar brake protein YcgR
MFECYNQSMQPIPHPAEFDERRAAPRVEIARRYSMRLDPCDGRAPITCALLDFSVTGVRLELPDNTPVPDQVKVLIGELSHDARIIWRKDTTVGIDFVDEHHSIF